MASTFGENYVFFRKWQKTTFCQNFFKQPTKHNLEFKMLELHGNHLKTNVYEGLSQFFFRLLNLIFANIDQNMPKKSECLANIDLFGTFVQNFPN